MRHTERHGTRLNLQRGHAVSDAHCLACHAYLHLSLSI
jgi:hypothetical protein